MTQIYTTLYKSL